MTRGGYHDHGSNVVRLTVHGDEDAEGVRNFSPILALLCTQ
jgi:hypothetical protein